MQLLVFYTILLIRYVLLNLPSLLLHDLIEQETLGLPKPMNRLYTSGSQPGENAPGVQSLS